MHRIIRVYTTLAVLFTHILHALLHYTVYGYNTVHRIICVYTMLSKAKAPYGATMTQTQVTPCTSFKDFSHTLDGQLEHAHDQQGLLSGSILSHMYACAMFSHNSHSAAISPAPRLIGLILHCDLDLTRMSDTSKTTLHLTVHCLEAVSLEIYYCVCKCWAEDF